MPPREYLTECFDYDPHTGALTWKMRPSRHFATKRGRSVFNAQWAGKPALNVVHSEGYRCGSVRVEGVIQTFYAHRIIWKLTHNQEPIEIDHINRNRQDNRLENLRAVTPRQNKQNMPLRGDNTSGVCGVYAAPHGRWHVRIDSRYRSSHPTKDAAVAARKALERELGYMEGSCE